MTEQVPTDHRHGDQDKETAGRRRPSLQRAVQNRAQGDRQEPSFTVDVLARETEVVLRDGSALRLRPVRSEDEDALVRFYQGLSPDSLFNRFLAAITEYALFRWVQTIARTPPD
jgi:hypothetical protein